MNEHPPRRLGSFNGMCCFEVQKYNKACDTSQRVMLPKFLAKISPTCQNLGPFLSTFQTMGWVSAISRPFLVKISNSRGALGKAKKYGGKGSGSPESELEACVVCLSLPLFRKNNFPVIRL